MKSDFHDHFLGKLNFSVFLPIFFSMYRMNYRKSLDKFNNGYRNYIENSLDFYVKSPILYLWSFFVEKRSYNRIDIDIDEYEDFWEREIMYHN